MLCCHYHSLQQVGVTDLKEKIKARTGIDKDSQRLIYGGKQLQDGKKLEDYPPLNHGSTIFLVLRLLGGASIDHRIDPKLPRSKEPCMITFENDSPGYPVFVMPCRHSMSPNALMEYCWSELRNRKCQIRCPTCNQEWTMDTICKYGCVEEGEKKQLEIGLSNNFCQSDPNVLDCPSCTSFCERKDSANQCVQCVVCTKKKGKSYCFCWQCLKEWKNGPSDEKCGNSNCGDLETLKQLAKAPMVKPEYISVECPSLRSCPHCGSLIDLVSGCKHMQCTACSQEFCFVCLRPRISGSWSCGSYNTPCTPAPRQTRIKTRRK